jgi:hypothetical protein
LATKAVEDDEICPIVWRFSLSGMNSLKKIVVDDMKLRRNTAGREISNKANSTSMVRRGTNVLTTAGARLPFGNFVAGP